MREKSGTRNWFGVSVVSFFFLYLSQTSCPPLIASHLIGNVVVDYLAPEYHGKGIMTSVLTSLIENYFVPYLDAHIIRASAFSDNPASIRVQEKSGLVRTGEKYLVQITEVKGGGKREESVLEWRRNV